MDDATTELITKLTTSQTRLQAYIYTLTADREVTQDILQSTNLVIWEKSQQFVPGTNFIAWAFQIARNQVLAHRKKQTRAKLVFSDDLISGLTDAISEEVADDTFPSRQTALADCLKKIAPDRRNILRLRYGNGLRMREIAEEVGKTTHAVEKLISRLRVSLMRCIESQLAQEVTR